MTWLTRSAVAASGLAVLGSAVGSAAPAQAASTGAEVIVRSQPGRAGEAERAAVALGGHVEQRFASIDGFEVTLPSRSVDLLAADPSVASVVIDHEVHLAADTTSTYDPTTDANSMSSLLQAMGAPSLWARGITGEGIDVAVIDSGVVPVPGLDVPGKVLHGPDLSPEAVDPDTRHLDTFGHGTFLAGLIAARERGARAAAPRPDEYFGVAPGARIVWVKVADAHGATDVSQVLAAVDWVVQYRKAGGLNIQVLNLSFATDSKQSYTVDPLAHAVEVAWRYGIVVVTSAGNHGDRLGRLALPAADPYVLAVGASDTKGTTDPSDDDIATFSARGTDKRFPDVVAPGRSVQGLRVPGSYIDVQHGSTANLSDRFLRGSGTSQATALVSGMAALVLDARPSLQPDQVKQLFTSTADRLTGARAKKGAKVQGFGAVDLTGAVEAAIGTTVQSHQMAQGGGTLQASRGSAKVWKASQYLSGEKDIRGRAFDPKAHKNREVDTESWTGSTTGQTYGGTWTDPTTIDTSGSTWSGSTWSGSTWSGSTWSGSTWSGSTWSNAEWTGSTWSGSTWSTGTWAGLEYTDALGQASPLSTASWG